MSIKKVLQNHFIVFRAGITNGLGDLSLTQQCAPPPGKIRRRNALPTSDLFLQSRELQRLQVTTMCVSATMNYER